MALAAQKNREMFAIKKSYSIECFPKHKRAVWLETIISATCCIRCRMRNKPVNGYPARRRSLVDDARFETIVVKQTKQSVLEEARQRSNDEPADSCPTPEIVYHQKDDDMPKFAKEFTTEIDDEVFEADHKSADLCVELTPVCNIDDLDNDYDVEGEEDNKKDVNLTEEEAFLDAQGGKPEDTQNASLLLSFKDGISGLARVLKAIENYKGVVSHVESRPSKDDGVAFDVLVRVEMTRAALLLLIRSLRQSSALEKVTLLQENTAAVSVKDPWFPRHARDLDNCNHLMTKYEPELDMNHPGFSDKEYRNRRKMIAEIAFAYKYGQPIPVIEYTQTELDTWNAVFTQVCDLAPKHACIEYQLVFAMLQREGIFAINKIPQLNEMSNFLKKHTGFSLRPAAGLLTARDFLASLAFRVFQSTQYVRHRTSPYHTPEPDCIHELLGHMPLLADPSFAQFSQEIGLASLGASDAEIEKLSTVYWFTVEFGLCKENDQVKAYGAGLLSAYGELLHAISDKPEHRPFEPALTAVQPYQDQEYQPVYYVADSFEDAKEKFRRWVSNMSRPFEVRFNPHTERIEVLDSVDRLDALVSQMNLEMCHLTNAIKKLKAR